MRPDDFFEEKEDDFLGASSGRVFRIDVVRALRARPLDDASDVEVAVGLARLVHDELEVFGTEGNVELSDTDMREALLALRAVVTRLGINDCDPPFRNFSTFRSYWVKHGAYGSWQARRDILEEIFEPLHDKLTELETSALTSTLAEPVSPHGRTGWSRVDAEISEMRRHFRSARTGQDHRNVGNDCVIVLEAISRTAYDPGRHLREGETAPPVGETKKRLQRVIEDALPGAENAELRKLARASIEAAQAVKHRSTPDRRSAGIAADAVILLANIVRRLDEPTTS